jgi:hypothetical protein
VAAYENSGSGSKLTGPHDLATVAVHARSAIEVAPKGKTRKTLPRRSNLVHHRLALTVDTDSLFVGFRKVANFMKQIAKRAALAATTTFRIL